MYNRQIIYTFSMISILCGLISITYYYEILGTLYFVLVIWSVLALIGLSAIYVMTNNVESVRIPLDVVMVDNRIDYWRGKLCQAQHNDDIEEESMALIHIDVYQDMRVAHGLKPLPRVS